MRKRFKKGEFVFVTDMGDLFAEAVPGEWILSVLSTIRRSPDAMFLLQTKNPARYFEFLDEEMCTVKIGINEEYDPKDKKRFTIPLKRAIYVRG